MDLADATDDDATPRNALDRDLSEGVGRCITAPEMVDADGEERNETQHGCNGPSSDHESGKTDVRQEKGSRLPWATHPTEVHGQGTVHGPVG